MEIRLIGTGTCVPRLKRRGPSTLFRGDGAVVLADIGLGSLHGLLKAGVSHRDVTHLILTHLHPDHTSELLAFLFAANYDPEPREAPLVIAGGLGVREFMDRLQTLYGHWVEAVGYHREIVELDPGRNIKAGKIAIEAGAASHTPASISYSLTSPSGAKVVITGDTAYDAKLAKFAGNADLLVADASFPEGGVGAGHMSAAECARLAREAWVGLLVLSHIYPDAEDVDMPQIREAAGCEVILSEDELTFKL